MTTYVGAVETAAQIRKVLKAHFPGVRFSVRSHTYAGGSSIDIRWEDGPRRDEVEARVNRFKGYDFDGMQDMSIPREPVLLATESGQPVEARYLTKHIFCERRYSEALLRSAVEELATLWGVEAPRVFTNAWGSVMVEGGELRIRDDLPHDWSWYMLTARRLEAPEGAEAES